LLLSQLTFVFHQSLHEVLPAARSMSDSEIVPAPAEKAALSLQSFLNTELFAAAEATEATPTEAAEAAVFGVFV